MCPIKYLVKPGFQKLTMSSEQQQQQQQDATFCELFFFFFLFLIHYFPTIQDTRFEILPPFFLKKPDLVIGARVSI